MQDQDSNDEAKNPSTPSSESESQPVVRGAEITMRELLCHYLARVYEAGRRDTSYEEGETLDAILREVNQVLGFAGYEPESKERAALLSKTFPWNMPDPSPEYSIERRALEFVHEPDNWQDYEDAQQSDSVAWPPEWLALCEAVDAWYGAPVPVEDIPNAPLSADGS